MKFKTKEQAACWLAGFVDGEGCVYFRDAAIGKDGKKHWGRVITIANTDPNLIDVTAQCMEKLGIEYARFDRPARKENALSKNPKHVYTIQIRKGPAMWQFRELVPIQSENKKNKLDGALRSYRGLHCAGCGCLHDRYTKGCRNCKTRKYFRDRTKRLKLAGD